MADQIPESVDILIGTPTIYADGAMGFADSPQIVKFNLVQDSLITAGGGAAVQRQVCARIVLSRDAFFAIADWFGEQAKRMREQNP